MKVAIELGPGEAPLSRDDLAGIVRQLRHDHLHTGADDKQARQMDHPALQGAIDRSAAVVEAIRTRMVAKLEHVLKDV